MTAPPAVPPASPQAALSTVVWAWAAALYGAALLVGGPIRLSIGLRVALGGIPGIAFILGSLWIVAGLIIFQGQQGGHFHTRNVGLYAVTILCLAQSGVSFYSAIVEPTAPIGGGIFFVAIAIQTMILRSLSTRRVRR